MHVSISGLSVRVGMEADSYPPEHISLFFTVKELCWAPICISLQSDEAGG